MLLSVTGKQGICIYSRVISRPAQIPASRASVRTSARSAAVPDTGKQRICTPNTKNDRFPEIGKRSFCLPGLLGKSLKPCMCPSAQLRDFCEIASDGKMKKRKSRDTQITQECFSPTRASLPILRSRAPARSRRSKCRLPSPRFSGFRKRAPASETVLRSRCPAAYSPS